jgi:shikimate dehydrogenase
LRTEFKQRKFYLVGKGISHSISPAIHGAAFKKLGTNASYSLFDTDESKFDSVILELSKAEGTKGFNVTAPYKTRIMAHLERCNSLARLICAANTVSVAKDGGLIGFNTDYDGIVLSLEKLGFRKHKPNRKRTLNAVILGAGGASRACVYALGSFGFRSIMLFNRTFKKAKEIATYFGKILPELEIGAQRFEDNGKLPQNSLSECDLLISAIATPSRKSYPLEINFDSAPGGMAVFDLTYALPSTPLLKLASERRKDLRLLDGVPMLVEQAAKSLEIWFRMKAPRRIMMAAARRALNERELND